MRSEIAVLDNVTPETASPTNDVDRIELLRNSGIHPYPDRFEVTHANIAEIEQTIGQNVSVAGRVVLLRKLGKLAFATLQDVTGRIQIAVSTDGIGEEEFTLFKRIARSGDFVGVTGPTFRTRTGEFTVRATSLTYLGLAMRTLPDKWNGIRDTEVRYRQRYLDLIANESSRQVFLARSRSVHSIRNSLVDRGFFEVETPVFNITRAGALARPFVAHHNALDIDLFLRIAPETYLKRACAAGFNRCFEFAKCFRNEGISPDHLQEFLMLEFYACYWNFRDNMEFTPRWRMLPTIGNTLLLEFPRQHGVHPRDAAEKPAGCLRATDVSRAAVRR